MFDNRRKLFFAVPSVSLCGLLCAAIYFGIIHSARPISQPTPSESAPEVIPESKSASPESKALGVVFRSDLGSRDWEHYMSGGILRTDSPSLSPDQEHYVLLNPTMNKGEIVLLSLKSDERQVLVATPDFEHCPLFIKDHQIVFAREQRGMRHLFTFDLKTKKERQVTQGKVVCRILDLSSNGELALIRETDLSVVRTSSSVKLISLVTGEVIKSNGLGDRALFLSDDRIVTSDYSSKNIVVLNKALTVSRPVGDGALMIASDFHPSVILTRPADWTSQNNRNLWYLDVDSGVETHIGDGHTECFVSEDKCLGFEGYRWRPFIFDVPTGQKRFLVPVGPRGSFERATSSRSGTNALLWFHGNHTEEIYVFDVDKETFSLKSRFSDSRLSNGGLKSQMQLLLELEK